MQTWAKLSSDEKSKHSLFDCQSCMKDPELKSIYMTYPLKSIMEKKRAEENGWVKTMEKMAGKESASTKSPKSPKDRTRAIKRKMKQEIETIKKKTCVERAFGNNISLNQRKKMRLVECFETISECKVRTQKNIEAINAGTKKKKQHVCNIKWNLDDCIKEVSNMSEGSLINFAALARKYGVCDEEGKYKMVDKLSKKD